jgi:integrase
MPRTREAPFYLRSNAGRARLEYTTPEGGRKLVALGVPFDPKRSSPEERRVAQQAAEQKWRELTDGRVVREDAQVKTELTLQELYGAYLEQFEPAAEVEENARRKARASFLIRRVYGGHLTDWAASNSRRPDGTPRWRDDRTPLQRVLDAPEDLLSWRLLSVKRKTMRKEKSNLVQFIGWLKASGFIATASKVELPTGKGVASPKLAGSGRGVHIPLTPLQAAKIVAAMPERSLGRHGRSSFLVRPFFELLRLTGLRPVTLERLEAPRNWKPGQCFLIVDNADDKAMYGRRLPLLPEAVATLQRHAPKKGHIFGHHDYRAFVKAAAAQVLEPDVAAKFGSYHFRHFVATFLANRAGANLVGAQYVLGHVDLGTTSAYVHADEAAAADVLKSARVEIQKATREAERWAKNRTPTVNRGASSKSTA